MGTETMDKQPTTMKPTKLKASCVFCALSKLKCDRGQPQCHRCVKSGIMCHYSETRRVGKTRQIYAASHAQTASPTMQGAGQTSNSPSLEQKSTGQMQNGTRCMPNNRIPAHDQYSRSSDYAMPINLFDNFLSQDPVPIVPSPRHMRQPRINHPYTSRAESMVETFPSPESMNGFLQNLGDTEIELGDMDYIHDLQLDEDQGWDISTSGSSSSSGHVADCINRASKILQTLQVARTCTHSDDDRPTHSMAKLDVTLGNNRLAMDTVREILDCPCSHSMSVALLLVLITHQGMESYQSLLTHLQSGARSPPASEGNCEFPSNDIPLAIGGYLLDEEMRVKVVVQVIRSELEKMGTLLDTLAQYTEGRNRQLEETVLGTYIESVRAGRSNILLSLDN